MAFTSIDTPNRKKDHIDLCLNKKVGFKNKTNGFEKYELLHNAITEVNYEEISLDTKFLNYNLSFPFLISCMTGGTIEAESINANLASVASEMNIAVGVGSQRQALENNKYHNSYKIIRDNAPSVPILGNLGAAQISKLKNTDSIKLLIDLVNADAFVIHLNPLQELIQKEGDTNFSGLLKSIEKLCKEIEIPIFAKEVGAGISKSTAKKLLNVGIKGIDVAGAGGTSWAGVEYKRNKSDDESFWDWGLPTAYCVRKVSELKKKRKFTLISSGGISDGLEIAKSIALGADMVAIARPIIKKLESDGIEGVKSYIYSLFDSVKKLMYLTGAKNIKELKTVEIINKKEIY